MASLSQAMPQGCLRINHEIFLESFLFFLVEKLREKDIEVLYFLDERDEFVTGMINTYAEKQFQSISAGNLDLESDDEKKNREEKAEANKAVS